MITAGLMLMLSAFAQQEAKTGRAQQTQADEREVSEDVYVFADQFARWERRWWVETEVVLLEPMTLFAMDNHEVTAEAIQIRAMFDCGKDWKLTANSWEVSCKIEEIGLQLAPRHNTRWAADVVEELDLQLTGAILQLQVGANGQVSNVDLEGIEHRNKRMRLAVEALRQLMSRAILPFHLKQPPVIRDGVRWEEHNSRLLTLPSKDASAGSSKIAHYLDPFEGMLLVQSIGRGTITSQPGKDRMYIDVDGVAIIEGMPIDLIEVDLNGVALYDPADGVLSERVWSVKGNYTAGSPSTLAGGTYWYAGSLRVLDEDEQVDVGPSRLVNRGRHPLLPKWKHLSP